MTPKQNDQEVPVPQKTGQAQGLGAVASTFFQSRGAKWLLQWVGSLFVAVLLMSVLIIVLAWGTFIESSYGSGVARFVLYDTFWFACLIALLGVNVLAAMLVRFPFRKAHWPCLTAHGGILILLVGCLISWLGGEEAQLTLPEGTAGRYAIDTSGQHFELSAYSDSTPASSGKTNVSFRPGPFNWEDYTDKWFSQEDRGWRQSLWFGMRMAKRDTGVLSLPASASSDFNDLKLKVLDFYASSDTQPVPPLELSLLWKKPIRTRSEEGHFLETARIWESVSLHIKPESTSGMMELGMSELRGARAETAGNERILHYISDSMGEVAAFLTSKPKPDAAFGIYGQLVFFHNGNNYYVNVDDLLAAAQEKKPFPMEGTKFHLTNVRFRPRMPLLSLDVVHSDGTQAAMTLVADAPDINVHANIFGLFGTYWFDPQQMLKEMPEQVDSRQMQRMGRPRIDLMQGPDKKLYYRYWTGQTVLASGEFPESRASSRTNDKPTLHLAAGTPDEVDVVVERFFAHDLPGKRIVSEPVHRRPAASEPRVKLSARFNGVEETFWLRKSYPTLMPIPPERDQVHYLHGNDKTLRIVWRYNTLDLGVGVFMKHAEQLTEPGSGMSASFSSRVDFITFQDEKTPSGETDFFIRSLSELEKRGRLEKLREDVLIKMNHPGVYSKNGRAYRFYQSQFQGPFYPDDARFHTYYDGKIFPWEERPRESIAVSTLSINSDPGRGFKYLGSFLMIFGSVWLIHRRKPG